MLYFYMSKIISSQSFTNGVQSVKNTLEIRISAKLIVVHDINFHKKSAILNVVILITLKLIKLLVDILLMPQSWFTKI